MCDITAKISSLSLRVYLQILIYCTLMYLANIGWYYNGDIDKDIITDMCISNWHSIGHFALCLFLFTLCAIVPIVGNLFYLNILRAYSNLKSHITVSELCIAIFMPIFLHVRIISFSLYANRFFFIFLINKLYQKVDFIGSYNSDYITLLVWLLHYSLFIKRERERIDLHISACNLR